MMMVGSPRLSESAPCGSGEALPRFAADPACLRVEFFGASAAGKTTAAVALSAVLRERGVPVRLIQGGRAAAPGAIQAKRSRLSTSVQLMKLAVGLPALLLNGRREPAIRELLTILSPGNRVRQLRIRRYAADLCHAWRNDQRAGEVLILDQGFLTLMCSMALLSYPIDRSALARALALIPRADLLIYLDAPRAVLEGRLQERARLRRGLERLFENEIGVRLRQAEIATIFAELLAERGQAPLCVRSVNRSELDAGLEMIALEIVSMMGDTPE